MDFENDYLLQSWEDDSLFLENEFDIEHVASSFASCNDSQKSNSETHSKGETFFKQIDDDLDYAFALSLQSQYDDETKENKSVTSKKSSGNNSSKPLSIVDEQWELIDPHPDIHALFLEYDTRFFYGKLKGVEVKWSPRMTLCAGVCSYEGRGGLCSVRLSVPLLKLRPRRDLVETLLHEMIHAYLFVTHNNKDRDGHGPEFQSHMFRINKETGTRITVYHSFHDEVDVYRQHWWKCDGPCKTRRPYYGVLKRAMNRAPGPKDNWWADHQATCGGKFIKIKEPENYGKKKAAKRKNTSDSNMKGSSDIRSFLKEGVQIKNTVYSKSKASAVTSATIADLKSLSTEDTSIPQNDSSVSQENAFIPFQGTGVKLGGSSSIQNSGPSSVLLKKYSVPNSVTPLFKPPKFPRMSSTNNMKSLSKDNASSSRTSSNTKSQQYASTSRTSSNNSTKATTQSPMDKFLVPRMPSSESDRPQENNLSDFTILEERHVIKVPCPVCFLEVKKQDINNHLDTCLLNN